jgi:hypothetical protein
VRSGSIIATAIQFISIFGSSITASAGAVSLSVSEQHNNFTALINVLFGILSVNQNPFVPNAFRTIVPRGMHRLITPPQTIDAEIPIRTTRSITPLSRIRLITPSKLTRIL